jgi:hypothetical protein
MLTLRRPLLFRLRQNFLRRHSPMCAAAYVENVAGQVRPFFQARLSAMAFTVWSLRDTVCWPSQRSKEKIRESSRRLCRGDDCGRGTRRLVGGPADAFELGLGLPHPEIFRRWTERDGPPVSAPKRHGFGTIVMKTMAGRSAGGAVDLDYAASGLTWRLTCPAGNALELTPKATAYSIALGKAQP